MPRLRLPVVVGELVVGIVFGKTGFGIIDHTDPTFGLLANIGFALVMFVVGTHVPVRDATLRSAAARGAAARRPGRRGRRGPRRRARHASSAPDTPPLYGVLMASSSAALALPIIDALGLTGPPVLSVTAQIAVADTACIVLLPLVIDPSRAPRAALGALAIAGARWPSSWRCAVNARPPQAVAPLFREARVRPRTADQPGAVVRARGPCHGTHVSIMLAGFALGLVVAAIGEPRRLARQLFGITEGFFAPLFFVWLGASLQVRDLGGHPQLILLGVALGIGAILAHAVGRRAETAADAWRCCRRRSSASRRGGDGRHRAASVVPRGAGRADAGSDRHHRRDFGGRGVRRAPARVGA